MSSVPPPPPPPPGFPPAPPPPPGQGPGQGPGGFPPAPGAPGGFAPGGFPQGGYAPGAPGVPSGYVAYGSSPAVTGPLRSTKGLGTTAIVLFSLVTIFSFLLALAFFNRKGVADDLINGVSDTIDDIDSANGLVGGVALLQLLLQLAAAIVVCLWAKRIADNAKARGVSNVSPGLACGGWFIPIANLFVPFNELRKSVKGTGGSGSGITGWQIAWIVAAIGGIAAFSSRGDIVLSDSDALDQLSQQTTIALVGAVLSLLSLVFAIRGIREANSTVSNNA